jgi:hypothetical protein
MLLEANALVRGCLVGLAGLEPAASSLSEIEQAFRTVLLGR